MKSFIKTSGAITALLILSSVAFGQKKSYLELQPKTLNAAYDCELLVEGQKETFTLQRDGKDGTHWYEQQVSIGNVSAIFSNITQQMWLTPFDGSRNWVYAFINFLSLKETDAQGVVINSTSSEIIDNYTLDAPFAAGGVSMLASNGKTYRFNCFLHGIF